MKLVTTVLFSILLSSMLANAALAQSGEEQTSPALSTDSPSFGINAEPIWMIFGGLGLKFEYFMTDKLSLGIGGMIIPGYKVEETSVFADDGYVMSREEGHLGINYMFTGTLGSRGLYINPAIGFVKAEIKEYSSQNWSGSVTTAMLRCTVGYQWVIAKHLRLAAGGGLAAYGGGEIVVKDNTGAVVDREKVALGGLAIDGQIGYVF